MSPPPVRPFHKVLVANRGEIALRVLRTCKRLGLATVAVYSDADASAPHVAAADEAVHIGPSRARDSYLVAERILEAARASGAEAIHPGYGFLSENGAFARACEAAGLVFIGPDAQAIDAMGNKARAKELMRAAGVPCIPGYQGPDQSDEGLAREARRIGLPVMVKAAAGGGGRGMRLVLEEPQLLEALRSARSEAESAFGSGELILEKAIVGARHVEVQVFADAHGNTLHLGERDCSVQRRHQKILEETPSPAVTPELRARMGAIAVEAARAIRYRGAGTIEFLLAPDGAFYFMEMNTRLQVEHPVTELVTGLDLVEWQLAVAAGGTLPLRQEQVAASGHAIEVRLCAEDPARGFLPQTGRLLALRLPAGEGVRVDHCLQPGGEVTPFYDSMQAKVVAHGPTREVARQRLLRALQDTTLLGVATNRELLADVLRHEAVASGAYDTSFIPRHYPAERLRQRLAPTPRHLAVAAAVLFHDDALALQREARLPAVLGNWTSSRARPVELVLAHGEAETRVSVRPLGPARYEVRTPELQLTLELEARADGLDCVVDGRRGHLRHARDGQGLWLGLDGATHAVTDVTFRPPVVAGALGSGRVTAPMDGKVLAVRVQAGEPVRKGQTLLVLEAMKMELQVAADTDGVVESLHLAAGGQVKARQVLVSITPAATPEAGSR